MAEWRNRRKVRERQRQLRELEQKIREKEEELQGQCGLHEIVLKQRVEEADIKDGAIFAQAKTEADCEKKLGADHAEAETEVKYEKTVETEADCERKLETEADRAQDREAERAQREAENEAYLREVRADIARRMEFEDRLCDEMRGVSRSFKRSAEQMMEEWRQRTQDLICEINQNTEKTLETWEKTAANAANAVVNTERRIRRDDCDALLWNFCELQEQVFYTVPERELGLKPTQVERYLRRFLKVLNRMGYEHYIPKTGELFDEEFHEKGKWPDGDAQKQSEKVCTDGADGIKNWNENLESQGKGDTFGMPEVECVVRVVHYGFKKDDEICVRAKVTVEKN